MQTNDAIASVRLVNKNHVIISPARGYSVITFCPEKGGDLEAIIAAEDGSETSRLLVEGPRPNQTIQIRTSPDGVVDITYHDRA